jgi:hypothetical protein
MKLGAKKKIFSRKRSLLLFNGHTYSYSCPTCEHKGRKHWCVPEEPISLPVCNRRLVSEGNIFGNNQWKNFILGPVVRRKFETHFRYLNIAFDDRRREGAYLQMSKVVWTPFTNFLNFSSGVVLCLPSNFCFSWWAIVSTAKDFHFGTRNEW